MANIYWFWTRGAAMILFTYSGDCKSSYLEIYAYRKEIVI